MCNCPVKREPLCSEIGILHELLPVSQGQKNLRKTVNYYGSSHGAQYIANTRRTRQEKELRKRMK